MCLSVVASNVQMVAQGILSKGLPDFSMQAIVLGTEPIMRSRAVMLDGRPKYIPVTCVSQIFLISDPAQ
jgi:hypothetical protein